jgi:hypothetical protein
MRLIKTNSSKWLRESFPLYSQFGWQTGYGAFTVSASAAARVQQYIQYQDRHHRTRSYQQEFEELLRRHTITNSKVDEVASAHATSW